MAAHIPQGGGQKTEAQEVKTQPAIPYKLCLQWILEHNLQYQFTLMDILFTSFIEHGLLCYLVPFMFRYYLINNLENSLEQKAPESGAYRNAFSSVVGASLFVSHFWWFHLYL